VTSIEEIFVYWTQAELRAFLVAHDLVIATGVADEDDVALSPRGMELAAYLSHMVIVEHDERPRRGV
jgi:hypothetical protein